jgi:hypothetical protein
MNNTIEHTATGFNVLPLAKAKPTRKARKCRVYHVVCDDTGSFHVILASKLCFEWIPAIIYTGTAEWCDAFIRGMQWQANSVKNGH